MNGYRYADTVKHTESVWADFKTQSDYALPLGRKTTKKKY
jgi:hypothetical protein